MNYQNDLSKRIEQLEWQAKKTKIYGVVIGLFVCGLVLAGAGEGVVGGENTDGVFKQVFCEQFTLTDPAGNPRAWMKLDEKNEVEFRILGKDEQAYFTVREHNGNKYFYFKGRAISDSLVSEFIHSKTLSTEREVIVDDTGESSGSGSKPSP